MLAPIVFLLLQTSAPDEIDLKIDGVDRVAYVCAPSKLENTKPPIIFMFHGHGGSAQHCMQHFYMEKRWPQAVVVYCDGLPVTTAVGDGQGWVLDANANNRDIKFFDALLPKVLNKYHGDPKKVFAWGFSNGGMFIYTLWSMRANEFAGFCASGAAILNDDVHLKIAKPAFITISGNDQIVPPTYQEQALGEAEKANRTNKQGSVYVDQGMLFKGSKPIVVWRYNGGHEFPFEGFPQLIQFFQSIS